MDALKENAAALSRMARFFEVAATYPENPGMVLGAMIGILSHQVSDETWDAAIKDIPNAMKIGKQIVATPPVNQA